MGVFYTSKLRNSCDWVMGSMILFHDYFGALPYLWFCTEKLCFWRKTLLSYVLNICVSRRIQKLCFWKWFTNCSLSPGTRVIHPFLCLLHVNFPGISFPVNFSSLLVLPTLLHFVCWKITLLGCWCISGLWGSSLFSAVAICLLIIDGHSRKTSAGWFIQHC